MKFNKKSQQNNVFAFFFILTIMSGLLMFFTVGLHYFFYDYGVGLAGDLGKDMLNSIGATNQSALITQAQANYLANGRYFDVLFAVVIVSAFIESCIAAIRAQRRGIISFFGLLTLGNLFLIYMLTFAVHIRGWFINEFLLNILTVTPNTPFMTMFYTYTYYIAITWYILLLVLTQIDLTVVIEKLRTLVTGKTSDGGQFEQ